MFYGFYFFAYAKDFTKDVNIFRINEKRSQIFMSASLWMRSIT